MRPDNSEQFLGAVAQVRRHGWLFGGTITVGSERQILYDVRSTVGSERQALWNVEASTPPERLLDKGLELLSWYVRQR